MTLNTEDRLWSGDPSATELAGRSGTGSAAAFCDGELTVGVQAIIPRYGHHVRLFHWTGGSVTRILVVDDDPVIRDLLGDVLEAEGYEVFQAANGQAAVEIARVWMPQVILMDLMMPVLDGSSAIRILKSDVMTRRIRIILMSAVMNLRHHSDDIRADGLLDKPFDLDMLLNDVAYLIDTEDGFGVEEVS